MIPWNPVPRLAKRPTLRRYQPRPQTPIHGHYEGSRKERGTIGQASRWTTPRGDRTFGTSHLFQWLVRDNALNVGQLRFAAAYPFLSDINIYIFYTCMQMRDVSLFVYLRARSALSALLHFGAACVIARWGLLARKFDS